jgi:superfamily II DNA or RNA helicase
VPKVDISADSLRALRSRFRVRSKFADKKAIEIYKETPAYFGFPLYYHKDMANMASTVRDLRVRGERVNFDMCKGFELRPNQVPVFSDFCIRMQNGATGFLLEAATGWGKSLVAARMLLELHTTALIIVPRDFLICQWVDVLLSMTNLTMDDIGIAQQDICAFEGKKIVIGMIHSLAKDKYLDAFKKYFGAVVWDECIGGNHQVYTVEGIVSLRDLKVGDKILNHKGKFVTVAAKRSTLKEAVQVTLRTGKQFTISSDHPVHTRLWHNSCGTSRYIEVPAGEAEHFLFSVNTEFANNDFVGDEYLAGLYLGDGHIQDSQYPSQRLLKFMFGKTKQKWIDFFKDKFGHLSLCFSYNCRGDLTIWFDQHFTHYFAKKFVLPIGDKRSFVIPDILYKSASFSFIKGIFDAEGYINESHKQIGLDLVCERPVRQLREMLARYGIRASVNEYTRKKYDSRWRLLVCGSSADRFVKIFGVPISSPAVWSSSKRKNIIDGLSIEMVKSVVSLGVQELFDISVDSEDQLFVCDGYVMHNCHVVGAETFSHTINLFPSYFRIGMSATPNRKDGMQDVFKLSIAQTYLSPSKLNTLVSPKVFLRAYKAKVKHSFVGKMKEAKYRRGILISELAKDLSRNALIAVYVKKFVESDRRVLIFSDRIEQLNFLRDILTKKHGIKLNDVGLFTGKSKDADRQLILKNSKIILATYGVMAMGVDVPNLRALVFATPLSDAAQSVGRILRLCEDVKEPVVLDIIDTVYDDCIRWARSRQKYYKDVAKAKLFAVE